MGTKQEVEKLKAIVGAMITLEKDLDEAYKKLSKKPVTIEDKLKRVAIDLASLDLALSKILREDFKS